MSARLALLLGAVAMFVAVAAGAFGAHALKGRLAPDMAAVWQTAVQYQAWHALALVGVGLLRLQWPGRRGVALAGGLFAAGIVLFSGSLYVLALTGVRGFGAITPFGGVAFLAGWAVLAWSVVRRD
ncbi:MAG: DUF423 domain-containing protein [Betaproteobacteria bacterium]|nr:DUF423 domain-containing protein [Betaproteobacteria bacterium]MCC7215704.1 DUF423 domain-containing protein [Burkholderiales bacterium]